jgi:hypothetical protein
LDKNKVILFVAFVVVVSAIYYAYGAYSSVQSDLSKCVLTKNDWINSYNTERDNSALKTSECENKILDTLRQLDIYKNNVTGCSGRIEAERRTCDNVRASYNSAMAQLRLCVAPVTTTSTTIATTTTTIKAVNNTTSK